MVDKTAPSADAGSDVVVNCTNPGTVLTASGGTSYTWNNGASQDATVSPNTTTTYTVTVTAANGCTATDVVVVTVDKTAPSANAGSDVVVNCSNPSTVLTASGGTSYTWNNGASQGGTVSPNVTTTYTVTVTAVNGCTATDDVIITSNKTFPTANAGSDITITCSNPSTVLIASGGNSYTWNNGASQGATVSPNTTTTYTVTVTDASGCTATDDVVVTVDKTTPLANAGTDVIITCSNPSTTLSATGGISYIWDNRITQGDIVSPDVTTTYTVTVTAANGCTATDDIVISIDKTTPTADAGTDAVVTCSNPSTVLTASGGVNYAWNNGTAQGGSVSPTVTTTYTVTVTAANGCTATDNIVVTANKVYPNSNNVTGGGSYCAGETTGIAVGLSNSQIGVNYQLINGTTNVGSVVAGTGAAISFGNQLAGSYTVVATTTKGGCVATMAGSAEITINPLPTIYNITGNGTYCAGETTGIAIGLSNSQIGVNYQLINGITNVGSVVAGTDAAISFGNQLAAGTYTVVATNASTSCSINMIGTSSIVIDETLPAFDLGSVPQNVTINCTDAIPVVSNPVATNACSTVAMTTSSTKSTNTAQCSFYSYVITHTWTATDKRGNTATISQTITVQDKAAPVIAPLSNITVTEGTIPTTVASMDNCMTTPVITYTETKVTNTPSPCKNYSYILTRTWIATDACGNSSTAMQTIKAEGISLTCPTDKTIYTNSDGINNYNCSTLATAAMGVAPAFTDGCDAGVLRYTITGATTGTGNGSVAGITFLRGVSTVTYSLLSNVSDQCTLNITVLDNEGPRFTMSPTVVIDACSFPNPIPSTHAPTLSDNCSGVSTLEVVADVTADQTGCNTKPSAQKYTKLLTRTWKATDINGNSATTVQRIYLRDNTPPITVVKNITVYVPSSFKSEKVHPSAFNNGSNDNCTSMGSLVYSGTCGTTVSGTNCKSSSSGFTFSAPITTASPMATFAVSIKTTDACGNISNTVSANVTFKKTGTLSNNNNGANSSIDTQESSETNTASTEASTIPTVQGEMKCYPTPFSEDLNVQYNLTEDVEMVTLKVYDNQGRLVKTLEQEAQLIGFYQVRWNLSDLTSGMYHVCLELNGKCTKMERVIMMK
jgi:flavin reductase (DIM6/NTAB) family NADH-FMN oxidoreductase RutF